MASSVALSILGMAFHTVREFGFPGLVSPATGMLPVASVQLFLFVGWLLSPSARSALEIALAASAFFQLLGGAVISVLPLPFLPFQPEQSLGHYLSHLVLGLIQLPLLVISLRLRAARSRFADSQPSPWPSRPDRRNPTESYLAPPNNSMEPTRPAQVSHFMRYLPWLAGRLISRPLGSPMFSILRVTPRMAMEALTSHLRHVHIALGSVNAYREDVAWLSSLLPSKPRIADIGCSIGSETLAISIYLDPAEVIGVDISPDAIRQARDTVRDWRHLLDSTERLLPYFDKADPQIVALVADLKAHVQPHFLIGDISKPTPLPADEYHLAYTRHVLYHLACTDGEPTPAAVLPAMAEISRVLRPGGYLVAIEPTSCSPESRHSLDLSPLLKEIGAMILPQLVGAPDYDNEHVYIARK